MLGKISLHQNSKEIDRELVAEIPQNSGEIDSGVKIDVRGEDGDIVFSGTEDELEEWRDLGGGD